MKVRLPNSFYNPLSYAGAAVALIALFMFIFLYVLSSISGADKAYVGIVIFILIPSFIILGLILIPLGMFIKIRRQKKAGIIPEEQFPVLNLNMAQHRAALIIFSLGTTVFLFLSALGSYEAYHFTESVEFCGTLCHNIMIPEYTAYQKSPHARVSCAECHIGSGANWWVKSKLSGLYQVYAAIANVYPRPIPTPIENLRPARETCEQCHWPQKVYGKQQRKHIYTLADTNNTRWEIDLLMNTGGGNPALGQDNGIHWHINPDIEIEYITTDEKRMVIPRVILRNKATGDETVYEDETAPLDEAAEFTEHRVMDCGDCHNRPSHNYDDPSRFINVAIAAEEIPTILPLIKRATVEACLTEYATDQEAQAGIEEYVRAFYADYELSEAQAADIDKAIAGTKKAFAQNIFPAMKVRWEFYPDHIGHQTSVGCFRCHDGKHVNDRGEYISHSCEGCHTITAQGPAGAMQFATQASGLEFLHPVDIDEAWREMPCYECHSTPPVNF